MKRIKPKWLLGGAALLVTIAVSTVAALAAAPTAVDIDSPLGAGPFYRAEGSVVRVDFTYTSNPTNVPQETTGTAEIWTAGGGTRVAYMQKDLANGTDVSDYINVTLPSTLSEGYYDVRVYINNSDGGPASDEESNAVLVDNSAPDAPTDLAVWEDDDTGFNTDLTPDGYLNDTSPTLNWTAADDNGATPSGIEEYVVRLVGVTSGEVLGWTETNNAAVTYTVTGPLADDQYTFYVKARDKAGNESTATSSVTFTIDTTPLAAPSMDAEPAYTPGDSNTVSWTNPSGACGVQVAIDEDDNQSNGFLRSEASIYLDPEEPPTSTEFSGLGDGHQYWYYARSQDLAGNWSGWSSAVTSTQDATAPVIGSGSPTGWVTSNDPTISATFTETGSGINTATGTMEVDGTPVGATVTAGGITYSATDLSEGQHTVTVNVSDNVGNPATECEWTFGVDTGKPVLTRISPAGAWATTRQPVVSFSAYDATSGVNKLSLVFSIAGSSSGDITASGTAVWGGPEGLTYTWTPGGDLSEDETYTVTANLNDEAGNAATPLTWTFEIDAQRPTITSLAPADGTWVTTGTPEISANVNDEVGGSGIAGASIVMKVDGNTVAHDYSVPPEVTYTPVAALGQGSHTVTLDVSDQAGNPATTATWTFSVDTVDPVLTRISPAGAWATTKQPVVSFSAYDATSGVNKPSLVFSIAGSSSGDITASGTAVWGGPEGLTYTWTPGGDLSEDETYTVTANLNDEAGNAATPLTWTFEIDAQRPTITSLAPADGTWVTTGTPEISANVNDEVGGSGIAGASIVMKVDGNTVAHDYSVPPEVTYTPVAALGQGSHTVTLDVSDQAGNPATTATWTFSVDTLPPVISNGQPTEWVDSGDVTVSASYTDAGSGIDTSTATMSIDGAPVAATVTAAGISFDATGLAGGPHTVIVNVSDVVGNAADPYQWTFGVDTTPPTIDNAKILSGSTDMGDGWETNDPSLTFSVDVEDLGVGLAEPDPKGDITWVIAKPLSGTIDETGGTEGWTWETQPQSGTSTFDPVDANIDQNGVYNVTVTAADALGNTATYPEAPATYRFVYDKAAPTLTDATVTFNAPMTALYEDAEGNIFTNDNTPTVTFTVADALSGFDDDATGTIVVIGAGGHVAGTTTFAGGAATATVAWSPAVGTTLEDGEYTATLTVDDDAENEAVFTYTFRVDTTAYEVDPGTIVAGNQHTHGTWYINTRRPTWHWTNPGDDPCGTVDGSGVKEYDVQVLLDKDGVGESAYISPTYGDTVEAVPTTGTGTEVFQHPDELPLTSGMSVGLNIKTRDNALNETAFVDPPVIFDPDAPSDPSNLEIVGLVAGKTNDRTPIVRWTHSSDDMPGVVQSGVDGYEVDIRKVGDPAWGFTTFVDCDPDEDVDEAGETPFSGSFDWECTTTLGDGAYEVQVRAKDVAGNYSNWVALASSFEVDATAPAVPGMPWTTSPTSNTTPHWYWEQVDGATRYNVYLDDVLMVTVLQPGDPGALVDWITSPALGDGEHHLQVSSLDALGNESDLSEAGYVMIDTATPAAPEMMELPDYTKDASVTFIWSAVTDAVKYDFSYSLNGGATWTTVTDLTVQTYTVDISDADDGDEICGKVVAWDAAGNDSAESNVESTIVDRTGPVVTAVSPDAPVLTDDPTPTWEWSGDDGGGCGVAGYWVTLDDDLTVWTTDDWFTPASALEDGEHYVTVVGVDELGNEGDPLFFAVVTTDATRPATPNAPVAEENPTADATPKWTWNAVTDEHGPVTYDVYLDGEFQDSTTETEWTVPDEDALADGQHYLQVTAEDALNNTSDISEPGYVVVDTTAPSKVAGLCQRDTEPAPDAYVPRFEWNSATDEGTGVSRYSLQYRLVGGSWTTVDAGNCIGWTAPSEWPDGTYEIQVQAIDVVGNVGEWSGTLTFTIDTTPPDVVFINPTEAEGVTYDITTSSTIIAEITGEFDQHKVWLSIDGGGEVTPTAIVGSTVYYVVGVPFNADEHTVIIRVQDAAGNEGSAEVTFTVEAYRQGFGFGRLRFENTEEPLD